MDMIEERLYVVKRIRSELLEKIYLFETIIDKTIEEEESIRVLKSVVERELDVRIKIYKERLKNERREDKNI